MTLNAQNLVAWHDCTTAEHVARRDKSADKGFRPLSISIYGSTSDPRFAAVMVKRQVDVAVKSVVARTQGQFQSDFEEMAEHGFGPFLIAATGPRNGALFAACFRQMPSIPLTRSNLSREEFAALNAEQKDKGRILVAADSFGTPEDTRYCAIWGPNPERVAWNVDALDEGGAALQQRFDAMTSVGARPLLVSVTPAGRIFEVFVDSRIGGWASHVGMTSAQYQAKFDACAQRGLWPVCVSAAGAGGAARFAAIFATREEREPRAFRAQGVSGLATIDAEMKEHVIAHNLRGAALAVVDGARLVYARGYTNAEGAPGYADVLPTTLFRQASVSKTFCAVAVWKLMEQKKLTLDTTLQSVLALTQPNGAAPKSSKFKDITVRHLLESRSGIDQGGVWGAVEASAAAGGTLPSNGIEVARWIAGRDLTGTPGDKANTVYGNTDYLMLSLIVATKLGAASFEAGLKTLVLDPLHMTRTRGSRSLAGAQPADEARHHMTVHNPASGWALHQLECGKSDMTQDRPLVPTHYGTYDYAMFDGCGGLSSAVVDVARLCAMFSCRSGNPVLAADTIDQMLAAAVEATNSQSGPSAHGYHGMDSAGNVDLANHVVKFKKGGWLPGQGSSHVGATGGKFYVYLQNGNSLPDVEPTWLDRVKPIVQAHDWTGVDLFPSYGMPSFGPQQWKIAVPPGLEHFVVADAMNKVEASITRFAPRRDA
jgi:CubicO group peptidase (beta-lactamase class C family)